MWATGAGGTDAHGVETRGTSGFSVLESRIMFRTWSNRPNAAAVTMVSTLAPRRASRGGLDIAEMEGRQQRPFVVSDAVHRRPAIEQTSAMVDWSPAPAGCAFDTSKFRGVSSVSAPYVPAMASISAPASSSRRATPPRSSASSAENPRHHSPRRSGATSRGGRATTALRDRHLLTYGPIGSIFSI